MRWRSKNLDGRLAFVHREIEILGDRLGYSLLEDDRFREVVDNVRSGKDTLAVKSYQDMTGSSLAEATAAVDEVQRLLRGRGWRQIPAE